VTKSIPSLIIEFNGPNALDVFEMSLISSLKKDPLSIDLGSNLLISFLGIFCKPSLLKKFSFKLPNLVFSI
jgi:hypothetical protein